MKTTAVYFSPTGTSEKGALAIANALGQAEKMNLTRFDAALTTEGERDPLCCHRHLRQPGL